MVTSIRSDLLTPWPRGGGNLLDDPVVLAQHVETAAPRPRATRLPQVPTLAFDPANPNQLQVQRGVVGINRFPGLEHGARTETNAIVLHMTGGSATSTLGQYANSTVGAHFLVALDGTITQTAGLDQVAHHVGNPRPKGYLPTLAGGNRRVDADLTPASQAVLDRMTAGTLSFPKGIRELAALEQAKPYGSDRSDETTRGPVNRDSIGIEFEAVPVDGVYPALTDAQRAAGLALVELLKARYGLDSDDVYEHPDVSYKTFSEAHGAKKQIELYGGE